jgi:hypothetical protein
MPNPRSRRRKLTAVSADAELACEFALRFALESPDFPLTPRGICALLENEIGLATLIDVVTRFASEVIRDCENKS